MFPVFVAGCLDFRKSLAIFNFTHLADLETHRFITPTICFFFLFFFFFFNHLYFLLFCNMFFLFSLIVFLHNLSAGQLSLRMQPML